MKVSGQDVRRAAQKVLAQYYTEDGSLIDADMIANTFREVLKRKAEKTERTVKTRTIEGFRCTISNK